MKIRYALAGFGGIAHLPSVTMCGICDMKGEAE